MKSTLPALLLLLSLKAFAQTGQTSPSLPVARQVVSTAKTFGYVNGIRLDSIDARYAEFSKRSFSNSLNFDFGQSGDRKKMVITDNEGKILSFDNITISMLLNFFDFNSWELIHIIYSKATGVGSTFILKRK